MSAFVLLAVRPHAEVWKCSVSEGWSTDLKTMILSRDNASFIADSVFSERYEIIYESDREIHLYRNEIGSVMTAISLFKETSELLELTFYPPSGGRSRHTSGGTCIVR
ncbi:MAG: hypothetical protein CBB68_15605 [Rhodospirillaceae bacterium TMED8]|nr:hypothetical protein [Magnetovibrio sp.]OUT47844.1 MAG: hypothetical protein CBB68_15605 [Rhodospirillaceae bacterium TMED8]|tara:strand:- start:1161 stop:1484 length:324 start_codon:yes stop_codon:yes gene_type:complete